MDPVFFALKRAHHSTLKFLRPMLASLGLTPARFDLLYVVAESTDGVPQSALRKALGVARATISEMLLSLERIGLVVRERATDRRTWSVRLTAKAITALWRAIDIGMHSGFVPLTVDGALTRRDAERDSYDSRIALDDYLGSLRRACGDTVQRDLYEWDLDLIEGSMTEVSNARYDHREARLIGSGDDILIFDASAGLRDCGDPFFGGQLHAIGEWEECV